MIKGLVCLRAPFLMYASSRMLSTASAKADKSLLSKLRKKTGFSFINIKKALEQFENDAEKAEKWLKEQAQKEGWAKATKLQTRSMSQGLIAIAGNDQAATMIEMNCETDFVARNNKFVDLTARLAQECHQNLLQLPSSSMLLDKTGLGEILMSSGKKLSDIVALEVGNIGENMALRRAVHYKGGRAIISSYVHASGPEIRTDTGCRLGNYGVLVCVSQQSRRKIQLPDGEDVAPMSVHQLGSLLGQHIVGMNPRSVGLLEEDETEEEKGDEREGKKGEEREEDRLVRQEFLLDPGRSVGQLLAENGVTVEMFSRFACGEELPEDSEVKDGEQ